MSTRRRAHRLPPEQRTAEIMAAARAILAEKGFHETLISDIAERAGVVEGSIYRYFENKRDLFFRVAEDWFEKMIQEDLETLAAVSGARNRLRFVIHRHLSAIRSEPSMSRLVSQYLRPDPSYRETKLFALHKSYTQNAVLVVSEGISSGEFKSEVSPNLVRDLIFGCIEHRTWPFLRGDGDFDIDQLADELTEIVYSGISRFASTDKIERLIEQLTLVTRELQAH